jgi:hypothetical protein
MVLYSPLDINNRLRIDGLRRIQLGYWLPDQDTKNRLDAVGEARDVVAAFQGESHLQGAKEVSGEARRCLTG